MRTHIKVVAIVNLLYSAVGLLTAASVLLGGVFGSLFSGSLVGAVVGSVRVRRVVGSDAGTTRAGHEHFADGFQLFGCVLRGFSHSWILITIFPNCSPFAIRSNALRPSLNRNVESITGISRP